MKFYEKTISKKLIYSGNYLKISNIEVELPNGKDVYKRQTLACPSSLEFEQNGLAAFL